MATMYRYFRHPSTAVRPKITCRHVLFTDEFRGGAGNVFPFQLDDFRTQALRELNVGVEEFWS